MKTKKLFILSFIVLSAFITGCEPDTHPANMIGRWKAESLAKATLATIHTTIGIDLEPNGSAKFEQDNNTFLVETVSGSWKQIDDYLVIEGPNGGFVAFRISSQSANQLTVFSRTGQTIQFNRIP